MRIAYVYEHDAEDINVQSGRPCSVLRQLRRLADAVIPVFPLSRARYRLYAPHYAYYRLRGRAYRPDREPGYLRSLARQAERRLKNERYDVVFAPCSHVVAHLDVPKPIVWCADTSFASIVDAYPDFTGCAGRFLRQGHAQDRAALRRSAAAIFPSEPAAREAAATYDVPPGRINVIPFGANVEAPEPDEARLWIASREASPLRLLFVGRDWRRKGADIVLDACARLAEGGVELRLDLVGIPRPPRALPAFVTNHGLLDKRNPAERERFEALLRRAHLFFVPSRAENYGMAFCEAAAFGVPSLTTAVGGIPTIVREGRNGFLLPRDADGSAYAALIRDRFATPDARRALARAALEEYHDRLNWDAFGRACVDLLRRVTERAEARPVAAA